ncbi:MAG TPA: hypothetical protein VLY23_17950 [Candidatus Acidoferrum sp.]|nr:hypothetical protein [Candidatus Acidoferrum sp.]
MKHWYFGLFAIAILVLALTFPAGAPVAMAAHTTAAATVPQPAPAPHAAANATPEPHPEIRAAIASLRRAKDHLQHAAHDFGGHRVEAIAAIDGAIHQLEVCLQYDK